ncbi:ribbon-helix-helix protein, CopG family [Methylobacterium nonmethylotrophicum]|uniref:Ribbon-helix-helix protein, CopG family n=1 Tax=Methylobacterium nonmethylotrophicum TaxID=1141884 RepID=A0A4Z0NXG1_9HYPH|nr:ribbon-helix-helix protein, CopG family [Methylobacterium nonmethylotrophicum]
MIPALPESCTSRLPSGTVARLDTAAALLGISRSAIARAAIMKLLADLGGTATVSKARRRHDR